MSLKLSELKRGLFDAKTSFVSKHLDHSKATPSLLKDLYYKHR